MTDSELDLLILSLDPERNRPENFYPADLPLRDAIKALPTEQSIDGSADTDHRQGLKNQMHRRRLAPVLIAATVVLLALITGSVLIGTRSHPAATGSNQVVSESTTSSVSASVTAKACKDLEGLLDTSLNNLFDLVIDPSLRSATRDGLEALASEARDIASLLEASRIGKAASEVATRAEVVLARLEGPSSQLAQSHNDLVGAQRNFDAACGQEDSPTEISATTAG